MDRKSADNLGRFVAPLLILAAVVLAGCASGPAYAPDRLIPPGDLSGVQARSTGDVDVAVAILTDEQAQSHFGVDLAAAGLQILWLRVTNRSSGTLWFIKSTLDPDYYPADEAAILVRKQISEDQQDELRQFFRNESIRHRMEAGMITEGVVFLPHAEGGRYIDIRLTGDAYESESKEGGVLELRFGFALPLPDGDFDYEKLDPSTTYAGMDLPDLDQDALRRELEQLPCCATDEDGQEDADPLNLVIVGDSANLLNSLSRCNWSFTHRITLASVGRMIGSALKNEPYPVAPVSSLYVFGRKQDFALQRARQSIAQRNHMRFWLAPFTYRGEQVWIGQVSRDIGIKVSTKSPSLTTHIIDPEVDLAREYLLHSLLAEGFVAELGFVKGSRPAPRENPAYNLTGDPYFSDGMRLVVILSPDPIPIADVRSMQWEQSAAPVAEGQSEEAKRYVRPVRTGTD